MSHLSEAATRVVFFQVQDAKAKLKKLVETAQKHFENKEKLIVFVENEEALNFVDELLWKMPDYSFLPHKISQTESQDRIIITQIKKNLNGAKFAFNLSPTALALDEPLSIIYEFEDLSSPLKKNLSSQRFAFYKKLEFRIEAQG